MENEERVGIDHKLIGEYVVQVSKELPYNNAYDLCIKLNDMVKEREGINDRFRIIVQSREIYIVVRKLLGETDTELGDPLSFINENLLGKENE